MEDISTWRADPPGRRHGANEGGAAIQRTRAAWRLLLAGCLVLLAAVPARAEPAPLIFVGSEESAPFVWSRGSAAQGLVFDLARAAASRAGLNVRIEAAASPQAQRLVLSGEADALVPLTPSPAREQLYDFSAPLLESSFPIFRLGARTDIVNLAALPGRRVGVEPAGAALELLRQHPAIRLVVVPHREEAFRLLAARQLDAVVVERWAGEYALRQLGVEDVAVVEPPLLTSTSRIAVRKGNRQLLARIDQGLKGIAEDGTGQRILEKWRPSASESRAPKSGAMSVALGHASAATLALFSAAYLGRMRVANTRLRRQRGQLEHEVHEHESAESSLRDLLAGLQARVAELARNAEALSASAARYRRLIDNLGDPYAVSDMQGRILECNDAFGRMLGYTAQELRDKSYLELTPPQWRSLEAEVIAGQLLKPDTATYEKEYRRKDGTTVPVQLRTYLIHDEHGHPAQTWAIVHDISARRGVNSKLLDLARQELVILDHLSVGIMVLRDRRLVWGNRQLGKMMGCEVRELIGHPTSSFYAFGADKLYRGGDERGEGGAAVLARGEKFEHDVQGRRRNGETFKARLSAQAVDTTDPQAGIIVCVEDITERQRTADELRAARDAAEAADRAKSLFPASINHEIRTPLNAILGMADLIERSGVTRSQKQRLEEIQRAGRRLLDILNAVLDLSKIDAGRLELEEAAVDIDAVIGEAAERMRDPVGARQLALHLEVQRPDTALRGDPARLREAIANCLDEVVKLTARGQITLRSRVAEADEHSVLMRFEVTHTGAAVDPEALSRLFTAFEPAGREGAHAGMGLGMPITRHLAEAMGGSAGASSEPGKGSTLWFTARLKRGEQAASPTPVPPGRVPAPGDEDECRRIVAGKRVLLVEDDPVNREVAASLLGELGLAVDCAEDGAVAIRMAGGGGFDLILMDLQMPHVDGLEATRRIRRSPAGATVPIIALTANAHNDARDACMAAGMNDFLTKPIDFRKLRATLAAHLKPGAATAGSG